MKEKPKQESYKKFVLMLLGCFLLILGVTLILAWWDDLVIIVKGITGFGLALAGMVILYYLKK